MKAALRCLAIFLGLQGLACARMSEITEKSKSRIRNAFNNGYAIDPLWFGRASADFLANLTRTQISGLNVEQARAVSQRMCHVATKREMGSYLSKLPADKFRAFLNETKHLNRGIRDRLKEVIVLRKMEEKSLVNWTQQDITEVEKCLGGLSPKLLLRLVKTSLPNLLSVKSKIERDHTPSAGQMKAMCSGARHYYGSPSEWYRQALRMFPGCLQTKELDNIPGSLILDSIESLGRNILNKDQMKKVCRKLQDTTWTEEKINKLGGLTGCLSDEGINRLDPTVLLNVLPNMDLSKIRRGKKRRLFKKITERKGGPANWTKEDVVRMMQLMTAMTLRELKSLNLARLTLSERRNIRNIYKDATPEQRKAIANGLIENKDISKWQSNDVNSLGSFLFELHIDEVFKIPPSALTKDVIGGLRRLPEISEALIRLIIKKADIRLKDAGELIAEYSLEDIKSSDPDRDLGLNENTTDPVNLPGLLVKTSISLMKKVEDLVMGPVKEFGFVECSVSGSLINGFLRSKVLAMNVMSAETVYDYIDVFKKQFYRLTTGQKEAFMELVRKKIGDIMPRDEDEVIALGPFVMYLKDEEIKNLTPEAAQEAVLQLISSRLEEIPKSVKSTLLKKLMQLKGKARALGRDMALRDLTDDDVRECAAVMVDIKPDEIDQLPEQYIKGIVEAMAELAHKLSAQQKQRLLQRYKQAIRGDGDLQDAFTRLTKDDVDTLGGILEAASVADLQKIPNQIVKGLSDVFGQMQFDKEKAGVIWSKMESASRRKKRNADMSSRSGADLIAMGSMLVALSKEEIATVSTAAFDEAAGVIGAQKGFSAEQLTAWAAKAKQAWNSPSSFTAEQLGRLGIMVAGFTPEELGTMLLRANDVVESLGSLRLEGSNGEPGYTASHLSKALAQVVKLKGKAISAFEGDDLIALKNFSLGMTPSDIESISTAAFGSAGGSLGDISGWSADHQRALKSQFVAVYGSVDTWTTAEVRDTGAAIGGLTASELQALSADHVSMIKPTAIAEMPANLFKEFSTEQLTALDSSQADFVTMAQMDALPADKKGILNKKKGSVNTPGSGAMISTAPQSVVALVLAYFSAVYAA